MLRRCKKEIKKKNTFTFSSVFYVGGVSIQITKEERRERKALIFLFN